MTDDLTFEQRLEIARLISRTSRYKLPYVLQALGMEVPPNSEFSQEYDLDGIYNMVAECRSAFQDKRYIYIKNTDFRDLMHQQRLDANKVLRALKNKDMIYTYEAETRYAITKRRNGVRLKAIAIYKRGGV